jgi:CRP-like cAMP-binding protein
MKLEMCKHMKRMRFPADTVLVSEGEQSNMGFWIRQGRVRVQKESHTKAFLEDGQYFGESSFLAKYNKRNATIVTCEETEAYVLDRQTFLGIATKFKGAWSNEGVEMQTWRI